MGESVCGERGEVFWSVRGGEERSGERHERRRGR